MSLKPLSGKTIVITRPKNQAKDFAESLSSAGARVVIAPTIRISPPSSYARLDAALRHLKAYDALIFTSQNSVEQFFNRAKKVGLKKLPRPKKLFAIGPQTAASLRRHGWHAAKSPEIHRGEELAEALGDVRGLRLLIPRAKVAREELPKILRTKGACVEVVEAYRTLPDKKAAKRLRREIARGIIDAVTFTSASTVREFVEQIGKPACRRLFKKVAAASIGPVTSSALKSYGINPSLQARKATLRSLIQELQRYFRGRIP